MRLLSGEAGGGGLQVYPLGAFSRALAVIKAAASSIRADVFGLVMGLLAPGLSGRGGGALSGSELSHLCRVSASSPTKPLYSMKILTLEPRSCPIQRRNVNV